MASKRFGKVDAQTLILTKKTLSTNAPAGSVEIAPDSNGVFYSGDEWGNVRRVGLAQIYTPEAVSPTEGSTEGGTTVDLLATPFRNAYNFTHASSDWKVFDAADSLVYSSIDNAVNLTSITATGLSLTTPYKWQVRYKDSAGEYSEWSPLTNFTTDNVYTNQASFIYPTDGTTDVIFDIDWETNLFGITGGTGSHVATQWQISTGSDTSFVSPVFDSGDDAVNLITKTMDSNNFNTGSSYVTRVRHKSDNYGYGAWSTTSGFTTAAQFTSYLVAIGGITTPFLSYYTQAGNTFNLLGTADVGPSFGPTDSAMSNDGQYFAVSSNVGSDTLEIYKNVSGTPTKLTSPLNTPLGDNIHSLDFGPKAGYLAFAMNGNPELEIYKRSGDTFNALTTKTVSGTCYAVKFSPDGSYVALGKNSSSYLYTYKREGDTFTNTNIDNPPTGEVRGIGISLDGNYLAVAQQANPPYVWAYVRTTGTNFTRLPQVDVNGSAVTTEGDVALSSDGTYMAHYGSSIVYMYKRTGTQFNRLLGVFDGGDSVTGGNGTSIQFSSDDAYLLISGSPTKLYKRSGDSFSLISAPSLASSVGINYGYPGGGNLTASDWEGSKKPYVADLEISNAVWNSGTYGGWINVTTPLTGAFTVSAKLNNFSDGGWTEYFGLSKTSTFTVETDTDTGLIVLPSGVVDNGYSLRGFGSIFGRDVDQPDVTLSVYRDSIEALGVTSLAVGGTLVMSRSGTVFTISYNDTVLYTDNSALTDDFILYYGTNLGHVGYPDISDITIIN